ncbi:MAG: dioxygenase [Bdellovibrionales bacterium]|nr:dioxygenase [Oligoflexia bacterium]
MDSFRFPTVFLSHGTPMLAFGEDEYQAMLFALGESLPKPKAVVFLSSHSISGESVHVLKTEKNTIHHDFYGFPEELYQIKYECPGEPEIAVKVASLLKEGGFDVKLDANGPLDHGIWIPLSHLYPKGDTPVVRVSLPLSMEPTQILKMGHSLANLRNEGVMIVASGGAVHNLQKLEWSKKYGEGSDWAVQFENFLLNALEKKDVEALLHATEHPMFSKAHPSQEHFLPLIFAVGAALKGDEVNVHFHGIQYKTLSMLCFSLNHAQTPFH